MQRLAYDVWEMARSLEDGNVSGELVDEALTRVVLRDDPAYTQMQSFRGTLVTSLVI